MRKKIVGDYSIEVTFTHMRVAASRDFFFDRRVPRKGQPKEKWLTRNVSWMRPWPRGGKTICHVRVKNKDETIGFAVAGVAVCSMSDTYDHHTGEGLAAHRAYNTLGNAEFGGPVLDQLVKEALNMLYEYEAELIEKAIARKDQDQKHKELREKARLEWKTKYAKPKEV